MIQRAELSQASQSSLVPEAEPKGFNNGIQTDNTNVPGELEILLNQGTCKSTAKKPLPSSQKETQQNNELEGNQIVNQNVRFEPYLLFD